MFARCWLNPHRWLVDSCHWFCRISACGMRRLGAFPCLRLRDIAGRFECIARINRINRQWCCPGKMPAKVLLRGVTANCDRGVRTALFPALPMLVVALMTLPATSAFAGSSILEIEPPLEATSKHARAE